MNWNLCLATFIVTLLLTIGLMIWWERRMGPTCIICGKPDKTGQGLLKCDHCGKSFCRTNLDQISITSPKQKPKPAKERRGHGAAILLYGKKKNLCNYCLERI
jgi:hypothetical protein